MKFRGADTRIPARVWAGARDASNYAKHGAKWLETFGESILFVDFDDIRNDPAGLISRIRTHVGLTEPIDDEQIRQLREKRVYAAAVPRNRLVARGAYFVSLTLQHIGAIRVVDWLRKSPIRRLVTKTGGSKLKELRAHLELEIEQKEDFREDIAFAESVIGRRLPHWRPGRGGEKNAEFDPLAALGPHEAIA